MFNCCIVFVEMNMFCHFMVRLSKVLSEICKIVAMKVDCDTILRQYVED